MKILVCNVGSTSIKFAVYSMGNGNEKQKILYGQLDKTPQSTFLTYTFESLEERMSYSFKSYAQSMQCIIDCIHQIETQKSVSLPIDAVGFRIVYGSDKYIAPILINRDVINDLETYSEVSPLHNPPTIESMKAMQAILGDQIPIIGVFDTAFHSTIPSYASSYALPLSLTNTYHIKRYGFHGLAHNYMLNQYCSLANILPHDANIITLQLGSGCSICAIRKGQSVDTSMGFTPMEGLMMRTRPGDMDPGILEYLIRIGAFNSAELEEILNYNSGLAAIGGYNGDMKQIIAQSENDQNAKRAVDMFCYRISKYIGSYMPIVFPLQAIMIGGGIGENSPQIRTKIFDSPMFQVSLDQTKNYDTLVNDTCITSTDSHVHVYVCHVDESQIIADSTFKFLVT